MSFYIFIIIVISAEPRRHLCLFETADLQTHSRDRRLGEGVVVVVVSMQLWGNPSEFFYNLYRVLMHSGRKISVPNPTLNLKSFS